jgi:hypothetical protein
VLASFVDCTFAFSFICSLYICVQLYLHIVRSALFVYCAFRFICASCIQFSFTVRLCIQCTHSIRSPFIYCLFTLHLLFVHRFFAVRSQSNFCSLTVHSLFAYPFVPCLLTIVFCPFTSSGGFRGSGPGGPPQPPFRRKFTI